MKDAQGNPITLGSFVIYSTTNGMKIARVRKITSELTYGDKVRTSVRVSTYHEGSRWNFYTTLSRLDRTIVVPSSMLSADAKKYFGVN